MNYHVVLTFIYIHLCPNSITMCILNFKTIYNTWREKYKESPFVTIYLHALYFFFFCCFYHYLHKVQKKNILSGFLQIHKL